MAVKKKVVVRKKAKKKVTVVPSEVFDSSSPTPETITVHAGSVLLYVNGRDKGQVKTHNQTIGQFVTAQAQEHGIRTFSVYVDGQKISTSDSAKKLTNVAKVELVAKDSRG